MEGGDIPKDDCFESAWEGEGTFTETSARLPKEALSSPTGEVTTHIH